MGKKFIAVAVVAMFALLQINVIAADITSLHIEQVYANMPEMEAYIYKSNANNELLPQTDITKENISATYGGKALTVTGVDNESPIAYFYLFDVSSSVSNRLLEDIKAEVTNQIDTIDKDDKIAVVTFGENVSLVCDAKDTKEQAKEKIKQIKSGENATRLYDGLSQILNYISTNNASLPHRKVVILITDGVDVNKGGATQGEVMSQLDNAGLSLYSLGIDNKAENKYLDSLGELARATGGRNYILESGNVSKSISSVIKFIDNVLCVNLAASNNLVTNAKQELRLDITVDGQVQAVQKKFTVTGWQKDETPPFLASVEVVSGDKLKIDFNEPVELPQKTGAVTIRNAKGEQIKVKTINWQDKKSAEILLEEEIYNGNYEIEINGGCDISMEKNKISVNKMDFEVNTNQKDLGYFWGNYSKIVVFGTVILILLIAGIVTVILINRRKKNSI
ncbi:MAG: VWA domain-containing protein, partial [Oscillospiraceae bacterium]